MKFVRVTELKGRVHWVNLDHVRQIVERTPTGDQRTVTAIHIDNAFVERVLLVTETPAEILAG